MLKAIIAYGQIVIGVPILAAYLLWYIPDYLIEKAVGAENTSVYYYMAKTAFESFLSLMVAYYIFELIEVTSSVWIPLTLLVVSSLWRLARNEGFMILFVHIGILSGYKLYPHIQAYMNRW